MEQKDVVSLEKQVEASSRSALDELLRQGAQRMLQAAIDLEVSAYVEEHQDSVSAEGRRLAVYLNAPSRRAWGRCGSSSRGSMTSVPATSSAAGFCRLTCGGRPVWMR